MEQIETLLSLEQVKILADARRQDILRLLAANPATLTQLGQTLNKSSAWIQHHIKILEKAGLVEMIEVRSNGRNREKFYKAMKLSPVLPEFFGTCRQKSRSQDIPAEFCMKPIGVIHTPFQEATDMPIQASRSTTFGELEIFSEFEAGLESIEGLSHLILIYVFHQALNSTELMAQPFLDDKTHGIFATRFYRRPNPIGISVVRLIERTGLFLKIQSVDMLDGTPLLDIKPYVPEFDVHSVDKLGWYATRAHK